MMDGERNLQSIEDMLVLIHAGASTGFLYAINTLTCAIMALHAKMQVTG